MSPDMKQFCDFFAARNELHILLRHGARHNDCRHIDHDGRQHGQQH